MKVLVCGTGAMGSLFSGLLSAAGAEVTVLGTWSEALARISSVGIKIFKAETILFQSKPLRVISEVTTAYPFDVVLILVKTYQTAGLLPRLARLGVGTPILTLQNGYGNVEAIAAGLPNPVWAGVTNIGATLIGPGEARWVGDGGTVLPDEPIFREVFDGKGPLGIKTQFAADTDQAIWDKLIINAAINPITAIYAVKNGALLQPGLPRERMLAIAAECAAVGLSKGMDLKLGKVLEKVDNVLRATAENRSSMLSDVSRGGRTEIDSITGAVLGAGRSAGVKTPENERVYAEVKLLEG